MKTLNLKRMASVLVVMLMAVVAMAQTPERIYNDFKENNRTLVREICSWSDDGYVLDTRCEMQYDADGSLLSKNVYKWDADAGSWTLARSYFYTTGNVRMVSYKENGSIAVSETMYADNLTE